MELHPKAGLTIAQRAEIKQLYQEEKVSVATLSERCGVSTQTIHKWIKRDSPQDKSSRPQRLPQVVPPAYEQAVLARRETYPHEGPICIVFALKTNFASAHRGTISRILKATTLSKKRDTS